MGRPRTSLPPGQADEALAYAQRALNRKAEYFSAGLKETKRSLGALRRRSLTLRQGDFAVEANSWLEQHLTAEGRQAMLAALRQSKAGASRQEASRVLRLPLSTHAALTALAVRRGLTVAALLSELMAGAASADDEA
jgi:hypothetical protein